MFHLPFLFDISILFYSCLSIYCITYFVVLYIVQLMFLFLPLYFDCICPYLFFLSQWHLIKFIREIPLDSYLSGVYCFFFCSVDQIKNIFQSWFVVYCRRFCLVMLLLWQHIEKVEVRMLHLHNVGLWHLILQEENRFLFPLYAHARDYTSCLCPAKQDVLMMFSLWAQTAKACILCVMMKVMS